MKHKKTAERLVRVLEMYNIKAQELADKSGVSKSSISQYINGIHAPSNISAGKMAEVFDISPVWLMGFDVPMEEGYYSNIKKKEMEEMLEDKDMKVLYHIKKRIAADKFDTYFQLIKGYYKSEHPEDTEI